MRISTLQQYQINIDRMQNSQNTIGELQRQISTGKTYHQPSDAPAVAAESIRLERDLAALDRYDGNMGRAKNRLELEEVMLGDMNVRLDVMHDLVESIQGTLNDANLDVKAHELREIVASLAGAMNKRDAQGEYIFSGSKGYTQPYELNASGRWEYMGDNGQREIQVGATHYVDSNDSGQFLFESVPGELQYGHSGAVNVKFPDNLSFATDEDKAEFEAFLKDDVKGDLQLRTYPVPSGAAGDFTFEIVDTAGTVHYSNPPASPVTFPLGTPISFKGADIDVIAPVATDYSFPATSATRGGVENITITDSAAMDTFFADYGEVTLELVTGTDTYKLASSKTGGYVTVNGEDEWVIPSPSGVISEGGLAITATLPVAAAGGSFLLKEPSSQHTVTQVSSIDKVEVDPANLATFETMVTALPAAAAASLEVTMTSATTWAATVPGSAAITGTIVAGTSTELVAYGVKFSFPNNDQPVDGEKFTVDLRDSSQQLVTSTSTTTVDYERKNMLNIGLEIAEQLEKGTATPELEEKLNEMLAQTITDIQIAQDQINTGISGVGARVSSLEATENANSDIRLFTKTTLSNIQDADLAEVATKFKLEQTLLQASQQTFATTSRMSLFDYIK